MYHDIHKVVQFCQTFTFRRFNHQRTVYREGEGRCMVTVVHQTLGNIIFRDSAFFVYLPAFQNHLMTYETVLSAVYHSIRIFQASGQVVGIQNSCLSRSSQTFCPHHADVAVSNRQDTGTSIRSSRYFILRIARADMSRKERHQMLGHTNRTYTRTATTVGARECLMQVQVTHVCSDSTRIGQSHLSVHVGSVHINLCTARMDNLTYLLDFFLKNTMSRRISNHQSCQFILMCFSLRTQIFQIHVSILIASTRQRFVTCLYSRSRIGAMCRGRNQYQSAVTLSDAFLVTSNHAQTRIFTCCTGIRLERYACKACNRLQLFRQIVNQSLVSRGLVFRNQRVKVHPGRIAKR